MLFLRRTAGRSITFVQNGKVIAKITFLCVDLFTRSINISIKVAFDPVSKERTLTQGQEITFLEGIAMLKFSCILEYDKYPPDASVGIKAPKSIKIYRSERLTGLSPEQIAALRQE